MAIRNLAISSPAPVQRFAVPNLSIASNQTINGLTNCSCSDGCSVLPVDLLSFEGRRLNAEQVLLYWRTANEIQNQGFEVQRSLGNTTHFQPVAFVPAQNGGAPEHKYELTDPNNYTGISYYRLKQMDLDGNYTFSETIAIKGYSNNPSLALYPNPVFDKLTAEVFSLTQSAATLLITDASQKILYSRNLRLNKGINIISLPASVLSAGVYFVQVRPEASAPMLGKFVKL